MNRLVEWHRELKIWIGDGTGAPDTIMHIHAGLAILMLARVLTRRSLGSFVPWTIVLVIQSFNEVLDRIEFGSWRWDDTLSDMANTMFWPTVICLGVRLRPLLSHREVIAVPVDEPVESLGEHHAGAVAGERVER